MIPRPRIIYVVRLGEIHPEQLETLGESIKDQFGAPVQIMDRPELAAEILDPVRKQCNSNLLLKRLLEICPPDALKILGVTHFDLFSPIFAYLFGEAQFRGRGAVISTYRLGGNPAATATATDCPPLIHRLEKEAIHELGHTFGLRHCVDPDCVMHYSVGVQCADRKFAFFCPACRDVMLWHMAGDLFLKV